MNIEPAKTTRQMGRLIPNPKLKLREQFHEVMRFKHLSQRTEEAYWSWVVRFLRFHQLKDGDSRSSSLRGWQHPKDLPMSAVSEFLSDLATRLKVAAATQNQAFHPVR
jgi:hypothetical protein